MENFLKEPNKEELRELTSKILTKEWACIKASFKPEDLIFSFLIFKYGKVNAISFSSDNCEIQLITNNSGKFISIEGKQYYLGLNSFVSIFPLSIDDILPIISGITVSTIIERRNYSDFETEILNDLIKLGVVLEENLKIPNYKSLPLFFSLMLSFDPYIPDITGNRENSIKMLKEINIQETDKLEDIDETKLNSLIYKIISSELKINPKFSREQIITKRAYYLEYDSLELAFALIYFLDLKGNGDLFQFVISPNYAETLIYKFREELSKGFYIKDVSETASYYIVESNLKSPTLIQLILLQNGKIKRNKPVAIKNDEGVFTSRLQVPSLKEGLVKIEYNG
ncbi:single-stranded DNA exonuclease [Sulfolobus sp. S-194]|uniref:single-stranded DNA exonuclease n=1 Tax=Sulfolobus sp. S-194 TaxID=2512240 RepID=UPI00143706DD|nr:single-stranded DNA exonuclease [Sulfolobus sp. S-194]QIW25050.1 single-stranded DNA exonuclease [Sulfolobus sp. S-194]